MTNLGRKNDKLAGIIILVCAAIAVRWPFMEFTVDDAYITLRYADNLVNGLGFVYNPGERVLGTTTPLFTLILAAIGLMLKNPLPAGKIMTVLCDALVAGIVLQMTFRWTGKRWIGYWAGILYALNPVSIKWAALGMETGLYTFLICLSLREYMEERFRTSYVLAGLALLTRIDGVLVFAVLLGADLIRRRRQAIADCLVGAFPVVVWACFALVYFGSPIPQSALAKSVTYGGRPLLGQLELIFDKFLWRYGLITAMAVIPAIAGAIYGIRRHRSFKIVMAWCFLYWSFYILSGSNLHGWYMAPPIWVYVLSIGLGLYVLTNVVSGWHLSYFTARRMRVITSSVMVIAIGLVSAYLVRHRYVEVRETIGTNERAVAIPIGLWLKEYADPTDTVCLESIGAVGYYSGLYILDEVGLVSPQVIPLNQINRRGPNFAGIVRTFSPKYYVWWETWEQEWWRDRPDQLVWLNRNYQKVRVFARRGSDYSWGIWQRR